MAYDAYYSLSYEGRSREVILYFYDSLSKIINPLSEPSKIQKSLDKLFEIYAEYIEGKDIFLDIGVGKVNISNYEKVNLSDTLEIFYTSAEQYSFYTKKLEKDDIKNLYIKNVQDYYAKNFVNHIPSKERVIKMIGANPITRHTSTLKQSLMEFNNFLSHVYAALTSTSSKVTTDNLNRAQGHLHRSALDFYKAIIKNLKFLDKLNPDQEKLFLQVRALEYKSIGHDHDNRTVVIDLYHDIVIL